MSLSLLILYPQQFQLYYNCTSYDVDSIAIEKRQHIFVGMLYIFLGLGNELMYIPCVWALWRLFSKDRNAPTCYKLMFYLGIVDCLGIIWSALFTGVWSMQGAVYCSQQILMHVICTLGLACWFAANTTTVILSINRCMVIYDTDLADSLFRGKRTLIWLSIPTFGSIVFVWLFPPLIYNSIDSSAIFNPHMNYLPDSEFYHNPLHVIYNWSIVVCIVAIYSVFAVFFTKKMHFSGGQCMAKSRGNRLKTELSTFLQVLITCTLVVFTSLGFIYQQYLASIPIIVFIGYICHQGSPAMVYLCMNKSIRNTILHAVGARTGVSKLSIHPTGPTKSANTISNINT